MSTMSSLSASQSSPALTIENCVNEICPWSGNPVSPDSLTLYRDRVVGFCNQGCRDRFEKATRHFDEALRA
ncbi:MAG: glutathione S-transferase [Pseudomonadota bacterium]